MASGEPQSGAFAPPVDVATPEVVVRDKKYICVSCKELLKPPVKQTECGHRMCSTCLDGMIQSGQSMMCPGKEEGCVELTKEAVYPDFGTDREMKNMLVYCIYKTNGCHEMVKWKDLQDHVVHCQYKPVECPYRPYGCREIVTLINHEVHTATCPHKPEMCDFCNKMISIKEMKAGHKDKCLQEERECPFKSYGCEFKSTSVNLRQHEEKDNGYHTELLKSQVDQQKDKIRHLENENQVKTEKIDQLQKKLEGHERECATTHSGLDNKYKQSQKLLAGTTEKMVKLEEKIGAAGAGTGAGVGAAEVKNLQDYQRAMENRLIKVEQQQAQQKHTGQLGGITGSTTGSSTAVDEVQTRVLTLEEQYGVHDVRLAEFDLRFQCLETTNYDGILIWKIREYVRRKADAVAGRVLSLYSQPFYSSKFGYKMCARVYLNGDGMGKGTHMSLFFVVMKGDFDPLLPWPFRQKVTLTLLDQETGRRHLSDTFKPDPTSTSFRKPTTEMNVASGCPLFVAQSVLESKTYLIEDTIYLKIAVDTSDLNTP